MTNIYSAPIYKLKELNNIFIELTAKNCNHRCKHCYLDLPTSSKLVKDFISLDRIKEALDDTKYENLHCIYLTGAEPMTHPDFNAILRLCLKRCNVCICTNGSFLNEKKIRFLNKVESEGNNQIFFELSLAHFDELESDKVKYRGNFRQTIFALKTLSRYNFSSMLLIQNHYNLEKTLILEKFNQLFKDNEIYSAEVKINSSYPNSGDKNLEKTAYRTDCMHGRTLGINGIYSCPFLSNDYRGRVGTTFKNYSENVVAETDFCVTCSMNDDFVFTIE